MVGELIEARKQDLVRIMDVDTHFRRGTAVDIVTDASPYGLGAVLAIDGIPQEYLSVPTTAEDARQLGLELSRDSKCQQAFEALALLVALRTWRYHWATKRCVVHVRSDNMAALYTVTKMQPSGPSLMVVARELALDVADAVYDPQLVSHIPGVANLAADALSRKFDPNVRYTLPTILKGCVEVHPDDRTPQWWRSKVPRQSHNAETVVQNSPSAAEQPDSLFQ